jgi:hypothetical protein
MNTTTHRPYHQNSDQREREAILRNDRANTFAGRAQAEADDVRGRWTQINKSDVVGATPTPQYPAEPNWSVDPTGVEPPLGIDVNTVEPCGEKFEIEALGDGEAVAQSSPLAAADVPSEVPCFSPDVERAAAIPNPKPTETR